MTSIRKLVDARRSGRSAVTMPWTARKSRALRYCGQLVAEALPLERRLGEDRAAQQQGDLQAHDRDDRDERVAEGVLASRPAAR